MPVPTNLRHLIAVSLALCAACLMGCEQDESVRVYQAPKDPPPVPQVKPVDWKLPAGWALLPDSGMSQFGRVATIAVSPDDPSLTLGVHRLDQPGSGDLLPNLNRWEGQLGLPPSSAADAGKVSKTIQVESHDAHRVDLTGISADTKQPTRMLAVVVPEGDRAWSFTLKGNSEKVAAQEANFDAFIASVHFPTHNHGDDHAGHDHGEEAKPESPPASASASTEAPPGDSNVYKLTNQTLPAGWVAETSDRPFRVATFFTGTGNDRAELIVSKLPADRFGSQIQNINRWRGEVGLATVTDETAQPRRKITVAGREAALLNFDGPDRSSTVALVPLGREAWFFKLIGPAKTVADQRANFDAFLQSLQFGEAGE
jgi:hypothetical protein